jgi:hypothetical protein
MKKLLMILTGAALIAGCHSRDTSTGGTYDETQTPGMTGRSSQPSTNNTQGSGASSLSNDASKNAPSDNSSPNSQPSEPDNNNK